MNTMPLRGVDEIEILTIPGAPRWDKAAFLRQVPMFSMLEPKHVASLGEVTHHHRYTRISDLTVNAAGYHGSTAAKRRGPRGSWLVRRARPMGDATSGQFRLSFNTQLRVEFLGATVTSDAGLLLLVENPGRLVYPVSIGEVPS
jgi:hypothetical protein